MSIIYTFDIMNIVSIITSALIIISMVIWAIVHKK